jgi:hypothetical protein
MIRHGHWCVRSFSQRESVCVDLMLVDHYVASGRNYRWRVAYSHWDHARGVERRSHMDGVEQPDVGQVRPVIMTGASSHVKKTPSERGNNSICSRGYK